MKLLWIIAKTIGTFTGTFLLTYSLIVLASRLDSPPNKTSDEITSLPTQKTEPKKSSDSPSNEVISLPTPKLEDWQELISFRPSISVQEETLKYKYIKPLPLRGEIPWINWYVQRIEDAQGPLNLDYYGVYISELPKINGKQLTPPEILYFIRLNINRFVSYHYAYFEPYNSNWKTRWFSNSLNDVLGCYIHIDMRTPTLDGGYTRVESGTVVVSDITESRWIFSTVYTRGHRDSALDPGDWLHPVSGNREFGWKRHPNQGYIFYTRGVDRISDPKRFAAQVLTEYFLDWRVAFESSDKLWRSFQERLANFVNNNEGKATLLPPNQKIEDWELVQAKYHKPSVSWVDRLPSGEIYPVSSPSSGNP